MPIFEQEPIETQGQPQRQASYWELLQANFTLTDTIGSNVFNYAEKKIADSQTDKRLSPEEVNERYPNLEQKVEKPISPEHAEILNKNQVKRDAARKIIQDGENLAGSTAIGFAGAIGAAATDPLEISLGFGAGRLFAAGGRAALGAARGTKIARTGSIAEDFAENIGGNIITEAFINAPLSMQEREDITIASSIHGAIIGGIAGTAVIRGARAATKYIFDSTGKIDIGEGDVKLSPEDKGKLAEYTQRKMEAGHNPNLLDEELEAVVQTRVKDLQAEKAALALDETLTEEQLFKKTADIDRRIEEFESPELKSQIREFVNRPENQMYYSSERESIRDQSLIEQETPTVKLLQDDIDETAQRAPVELKEEIKARADSFRKDVSVIEKATDLLSRCFRNG